MSFKNSRKLTQCLLSNQCSYSGSKIIEFRLDPAAPKNLALAVSNRGKVFSSIFIAVEFICQQLINYLNLPPKIFGPKLGSKFDQNILTKNGQY